MSIPFLIAIPRMMPGKWFSIIYMCKCACEEMKTTDLLKWETCGAMSYYFIVNSVHIIIMKLRFIIVSHFLMSSKSWYSHYYNNEKQNIKFLQQYILISITYELHLIWLRIRKKKGFITLMRKVFAPISWQILFWKLCSSPHDICTA